MFRLLEYLFLFVALLLLISQVTIPAWRGRPMWPLFRRRRRAEELLSQAREDADVRDLQRQARDVKEESKQTDDNPNLDFSKGVRGKYADRFKQGTSTKVNDVKNPRPKER